MRLRPPWRPRAGTLLGHQIPGATPPTVPFERAPDFDLGAAPPEPEIEDPELGTLRHTRVGWESQPMVWPALGGATMPMSFSADLVDLEVEAAARACVLAFRELSPEVLQAPEALRELQENYDANHPLFCPRGLKHESSLDLWGYLRLEGITVEPDHGEPPYLVVSYECPWEWEDGISFYFEEGRRLVRIAQPDGHLAGPGWLGP